jgi:NADH-quinone oxidoreductase subunit N
MWAPDVYDGRPRDHGVHGGDGKGRRVRDVHSGLAAGVPGLGPEWYPAIYGVAIASMIAGNAIGLVAEEPQAHARVLEHRHAGYLLVLIAAGREATSALVFYLLAYSLATFGAFAVDRQLAQPARAP